MACDAGQKVDPRRRVHLKVQIPRSQPQRIGRGQRKRGLTQFIGINPKEQVMHDRIADKDLNP